MLSDKSALKQTVAEVAELENKLYEQIVRTNCMNKLYELNDSLIAYTGNDALQAHNICPREQEEVTGSKQSHMMMSPMRSYFSKEQSEQKPKVP